MEIVDCNRMAAKSPGIFSRLFRKSKVPVREVVETPPTDVPDKDGNINSELLATLKEILEIEKKNSKTLDEIGTLVRIEFLATPDQRIRERMHYKFARGGDRYERALEELGVEP